jgi:3-deoxy-D-manno-octulosonic-acid transferase
MRIIYHIVIGLLGLGIRIASVFHHKAAAWTSGRRHLFENLCRFLASDDRPVIWFHCASLGEFEQGRPLIESIHRRYPTHRILLTFFSPSGYEVRKNYQGASYVAYLPLDTPANARRFVDLVNPSAVFFIKYEFWYNFLYRLHRQQIPVFFASAVFRPRQVFFQWYGGWFRKHLRMVRHFFVQDKASEQLLRQTGLAEVTHSGDTRFDRVHLVASKPDRFTSVENLTASRPLLVAGSTWPEDEAILAKIIDHYKGQLFFLIAPHEVSEERVMELQRTIPIPSIRFSGLTASQEQVSDVLVIDRIGFLAHLYQYAEIAYIGGGFGRGIHNILEAAAFGKPVLFGPNYLKFREATDLIARGAAFSITSGEEALAVVNDLLTNRERYRQCAANCKSYVEEHTGATEIILLKFKEIINI